MGVYKQFKTNKHLENNGVTLQIGDSEFRVRRAGGGNRAYATTFAEKTKPFQRQVQLGTLPEDKALEIMLETYWESVMLGWENVTDEDDNPLEYTKENFKKVMSDLPELWATLRDEAAEARNFQDQQVKEGGEQLGKSSSGTSSGANE